MTKPTIRFALPLLALLLVFALPCRADDADKDKPINYSSDTGGADQSNGTGDLTGNVTITQGTLVLHADRITFKRNPDNSFSAIAYGNPVSYRQKREGSDEYDEAYAQRIVYDGQKQLVELFDHALLKQGPTEEMRSNYISYNRATSHADMGVSPAAATAARPASRVTGVILPKDVNAADKSKGTTGKDTGADKSKNEKGKDVKPGATSPAAANPAAGSAGAKAGTTPPAVPAPAPLPLTIDDELKSK
ncbi:MAG: lipopolysaccharide transport periplasmic protein LptA [Casimicrobiaceae bacterium]